VTPEAEAVARSRSAATGAACGAGAFAIWGFVVVYIKLLGHVEPLIVVAQRVLWSLPFLVAIILLTGGLTRMRALLADRGTLVLLPLSSLFLLGNWLMFVWCTLTGRVVEVSLGYYVTPLVLTLLGVLFLGERPRLLQWVSLSIASLGVAVMSLSAAGLPWEALVVAGAWSGYSMIRRVRRVPSTEGLTLELGLVAVPAALVLAWLGWRTVPSPHPATTDLLLFAGSGLVTIAPLVLFGLAASRLNLTTLGVMQYIAPTVQFVLGITVYGEVFGGTRAWAFAIIWGALVLFAFDAIRAGRRARAARRVDLARAALA
jgi:chloramphenicol-sensitive protein RarD